MDCIFCSLVQQNPQNKISENDSFVALLDLNPVSQGHSIIVPRRHVESFFDLNEKESSDLKKITVSLRDVLRDKLKPDGYNIGVNDGEAAGSTTGHLLVHFIPRFKGDVPNPQGGIRNILVLPQEVPVPKEEPKPEPKEEPKPEPIPEPPKPQPKSWQELLKENEQRKKENERLRIKDRFK